MKTTFNDFNSTPKYNSEYFLMNMPNYLESGEIWKFAVDKATNNGKNSATFKSVIAIYNNTEKKQMQKPEVNTKYIYYKSILPTITWKDQNTRKIYLSILDKLKNNIELSQRQSDFLQRFKI